MSTIKIVFCLLTVVVAYGVVGRMDYEDAVMMENAYRNQPPADRFDSARDSSASGIHNVQTHDPDLADEVARVDACDADRYSGVRHVHRD